MIPSEIDQPLKLQEMFKLFHLFHIFC